jgi:serine/threonine protein kinase
VDVWSAGCIFAELAAGGRPLFTGDSEIDQLFKIFQQLGTPTAAAWPAFPTLPDTLDSFPRFRARPWEAIAPALCPAGRDLLARMLAYDPASRISAADALAHPYFADRVPVPLALLPARPGPAPPART